MFWIKPREEQCRIKPKEETKGGAGPRQEHCLRNIEKDARKKPSHCQIKPSLN